MSGTARGAVSTVRDAAGNTVKTGGTAVEGTVKTGGDAAFTAGTAIKEGADAAKKAVSMDKAAE